MSVIDCADINETPPAGTEGNVKPVGRPDMAYGITPGSLPKLPQGWEPWPWKKVKGAGVFKCMAMGPGPLYLTFNSHPNSAPYRIELHGGFIVPTDECLDALESDMADVLEVIHSMMREARAPHTRDTLTPDAPQGGT